MKFLNSILFLLFFLLVSCTQGLDEKVTDTFDDGSPKIIIYYPENSPEDVLKKATFYESGQLRLIGFYKKHQKTGKWMYFYENGNKMAETHFKESLMDGSSTRWHLNGELHSSGFYQKDKRIGIWYFYDNTGKLSNEQSYN
jgi:antitoxin component YwqK of YwqJK toxin-antitoxin module